MAASRNQPTLLQQNVNHSAASQSLLRQTVATYKVDVVVVSEPHLRTLPPGWIPSHSGGAAVGVTTPRLVAVHGCTVGDHFVSLTLLSLEVVSVYLPPSLSLPDFERALRDLELHIRGTGRPVVISGDWNARSSTWQDRTECCRGRLLTSWFQGLGLQVLDTGAAPTCVRPQGSSRVDITFASDSLRLQGRVLAEETLSDHLGTLIEPRDCRPWLTPPQLPRWALRKVNRDDLGAAWAQICAQSQPSTHTDAEAAAIDLRAMATAACDAVAKRSRAPPHHKPQFWWTDEIAALRRASNQARRRFQRAPQHSTIRDERRSRWKEARRALKTAIKKSKDAGWRQLIAELDSDPWGIAYKIVRNKLRTPVANPHLGDPTFARRVVRTLFPTGAPVPQGILPLANDAAPPAPPPFTEAELRSAVHCSNQRHGAPGLDGIPIRAWDAFAAKNLQPLLDTFNHCLKEGHFPRIWRVGRLVLLPKPGKDLEKPGSYKPLCLLDDISKLLERLLLQRLEEALQVDGGLHRNQYGFRKGRSTVDALQSIVGELQTGLGTSGMGLVVSVDIRNAFNSVEWGDILQALANRCIPPYLRAMVRSYLSERTVEFHSSEGVSTFVVSRGVPQGSVLGPWLWNLAYDPILSTPIPPAVRSQCFADDLVLYAYASSPATVTMAMNKALASITQWLSDHHLETAADKSEALVVSRRRNVKNPSPVLLRGEEVTPGSSLRYLGMHLDRGLTFRQHIEKSARKAAVISTQVGRLLPNIGDPEAPDAVSWRVSPRMS